MSNSKKAQTPSEGIYFVVPNKDGHVSVFSEREDEALDSPAHMFFWDKVLGYVQNEYKLTNSEVRELGTRYMAVPRGRVQKEINPSTFKPTGRYVILHGNDIPTSSIEYAVLQDFGLGGIRDRVVWKFEPHEKMDPKDRKVFQNIISRTSKQ